MHPTSESRRPTSPGFCIKADLHVLCADAVIMNYDTSIGQIFQTYGHDKDILFSKDYSGSSIINAGEQECVQLLPVHQHNYMQLHLA